MTGFPLLTLESVAVFILIFLRIGAIVIMIPVFGDRAVPARVKAGLSLVIALILYPLIRFPLPDGYLDDMFRMAAGMFGEILVGVLIGFAARCIFAAIQAAGEMAGIQIGFSMANVVDPLGSAQISVISEFLYLMGMLVFLTVDAHHIFLAALAETYRSVPPFGFVFSGELMQVLTGMTTKLFLTAVKLSAPVISVVLLINIGLAVIARTVPQINVFIIGFPIQVAAGLFFLGLTAPIFGKMVAQLFLRLQTELTVLLRVM
jgi:flagellar biosynthetic protein FliR